jgi:hypothetical protein
MEHYQWIWHHRAGYTDVRDKKTGALIFTGTNMLLVSKAAELLDQFKSDHPDSVLFEGEE